MNLYKLHSDPKSLNHYEDAQERVPYLVWEKYKNDKEELKKREDIWARDAQCAYKYSRFVLKGPFPNGENAIAKDAIWASEYINRVLDHAPFPKAEDAIAKGPHFSYYYAKDVLKGPFPKGEDAIAKAPHFAYWYARDILKGPFPKGENTMLNSEFKNGYLKLIGK